MWTSRRTLTHRPVLCHVYLEGLAVNSVNGVNGLEARGEWTVCCVQHCGTELSIKLSSQPWIRSNGHGQIDTVIWTQSYGHSHGCGHRHGQACPVISGGSSACVGGPLALCPCGDVPTVMWPTQLSGQGAVCRAATASARFTFLLWLLTAAPLGLARPPLEDVLPQPPHTIRLAQAPLLTQGLHWQQMTAVFPKEHCQT